MTESLQLFAVVGGGLQWFNKQLQTHEAPTIANNRQLGMAPQQLRQRLQLLAG
jgi:hypothetical protein